MKRNSAFALAVFFLLAACAPLTERPETPVSAPAIRSAEHDLRVKGPAAADQLRGWYNQTAANCGTATRPAFLCSGVMLRGTISRQSYLPWDPSPGSITSGGVSFAWVRTDTNFKELPLNYNNGFIFYPVLNTPIGKNSDIEVMCTFPFDAWTDVRNQQGCGTNTDYPSQSRPCTDQGINTGQQWITHFNAAPDKYKAQCGWNVREGQPNSADRFYQSIDGRSRITSSHWNGNNELRLATWATGSGAQLPIQSFFYVAGTAGLASAQDDQRRYFQNYNQVVPVIQLTLAADKTKKAAFAYNQADQVIGEPPPDEQRITFSDVPLQSDQSLIKVGNVNFRDGNGSHLSIKDGGVGIVSGRYLEAVSNVYVEIIPELPLVAKSISFDLERDRTGFAIFLTLSSNQTVFLPRDLSGRVDYEAPAGTSIRKFTITYGNWLKLDNVYLKP